MKYEVGKIYKVLDTNDGHIFYLYIADINRNIISVLKDTKYVKQKTFLSKHRKTPQLRDVVP